MQPYLVADARRLLYTLDRLGYRGQLDRIAYFFITGYDSWFVDSGRAAEHFKFNWTDVQDRALPVLERIAQQCGTRFPQYVAEVEGRTRINNDVMFVPFNALCFAALTYLADWNVSDTNKAIQKK